jgi:hypothetical protein
MRRRGFYIASSLVFLSVAMVVIGVVAARAASRLVTVMPEVFHGDARNASYVGMKLAEGWLLSSIHSGDVPSGMSPRSGAPLELVEAIGARGPCSVSFDLHGSPPVDLYVADADYPKGLFAGSATKIPLPPAIPRIPAETTIFDDVRRYFMRSAARDSDGVEFVCEELLAVSRDMLTGQIDARRLFFRRITSDPR